MHSSGLIPPFSAGKSAKLVFALKSGHPCQSFPIGFERGAMAKKTKKKTKTRKPARAGGKKKAAKKPAAKKPAAKKAKKPDAPQAA